MKTMRRLLTEVAVLASLLLSAPGLGRAADDAAPDNGSSPLRQLHLRDDGGQGPLDWVLSRVPTGKDQWVAESIAADITSRLYGLANSLGDENSIHGLGLLAPEFRGTGLLPRRVSRVLEAPGRRAEFGDAASVAQDLDAGGFLAELTALGASCGEFAKAKFKVVRIEAGPDSARAHVLLEMDGRRTGGPFVQVRSEWDTAWKKDAETLRLVEARVASFERSILDARPFVDRSRAVFGLDPSFREQLSRGMEYWWRRVDSATGMDIYGHQGVTVGDVDGDGQDDVYVPQPGGLPNLLYRNRGDGTFEDISRAAGVDVLDHSGGALLVDLDGDGDADLAVATSLEVLLFENIGRGRFRRRAASGLETIVHRETTTLGLAAADYDRDGLLDLYVFCYVFWAGAGSKLVSSYPYPYHDANNGAPNFLLRNEGGLRFRDVTAESGIDENNRRFSFAASWSDYDDDGDPDLYVANDFGLNNLYRNDGGRFRDIAGEAGVEDQGTGMNVTWGDWDGDGNIDLYVGNMWSSAGNRVATQSGFADASLRPTYLRMARGNSLFRSLGDGRFEDLTKGSPASFGRWSWGCQFVDADLDGREDLLVTNGFVSGPLKDDL